MVAKLAVGSVVASLLAVLVPLAAAAGALVAGVFAAVFWMCLVHRLISRIDGRRGAERVFPVAEVARPGPGRWRAAPAGAAPERGRPSRGR